MVSGHHWEDEKHCKNVSEMRGYSPLLLKNVNSSISIPDPVTQGYCLPLGDTPSSYQV